MGEFKNSEAKRAHNKRRRQRNKGQNKSSSTGTQLTKRIPTNGILQDPYIEFELQEIWPHVRNDNAMVSHAGRVVAEEPPRAAIPSSPPSQKLAPIARLTPFAVSIAAGPPRCTSACLQPNPDALGPSFAPPAARPPRNQLQPPARITTSGAPPQQSLQRSNFAPTTRRHADLLQMPEKEVLPNKRQKLGIIADQFNATEAVVGVLEEEKPRLLVTANTFRVPCFPIAWLSDFSWDKPDGEGSFGRVHMAMWGNTKRVAIKVFKDKHNQMRSACRELAVAQIAALSPYVLPVLGYTFEEDHSPCLVYEQGARTLAEVVRDKRIVHSKRLGVALQVCEALKSLHEQAKVLHLDLKTNNVLYSVSRDEIRLIDFGLSQPVVKNKNPYIGARPRYKPNSYMRPAFDYTKHSQFTTKTDIYALMYLLCDIVAPLPAEEGFHEKTPPKGWFAKALGGLGVVSREGQHLEEVVYSCVARKPMERPNIDVLIKLFKKE